MVVGGYGFAALYISPLAAHLVSVGGITYSCVWLGILFGLGIIIGGCLLSWPEPGYSAPLARVNKKFDITNPTVEYGAAAMLQTWQYYVMIFMFIGTTQSGLIVIANAAPILVRAVKTSSFLIANVWLLAFFGGFMNTLGRIGTGLYADQIGKANAYTLNCLASAVCLFLLPGIIASGSIFLLFIAVGVAYWQYGGGLALMPTYAADFFGTKNLGMNYGLIFIIWGL